MSQYPPNNQPNPSHPNWSNQSNNPYNTDWSNQPNPNQAYPYHNQQQGNNPGQYYPPAAPPPQRTRGNRFTNWYRRQRRSTKVGLGCGIIVAILFLCVCSVSALPGASKSQTTANSSTPIANATTAATTMAQSAGTTPTPNSTKAQQNTSHPTATPTKQQVTQTPTLKPTQRPTTNPTPKPTQPPAQPTATPNRCPNAVNGNPWCYDFNAGTLIYSPPAAFCSYFNCISNFPNGKGYVVECQDQTYSKSGGRSGSCSHHGGDLQPLYSH